MEQNIKIKLLESIGNVYEKSKECKLDISFFEKIDSELTLISNYFKVTKNQSFFVATVFALNYKGNTVDLNDLIEYFDCNPMKILEYSDDIEALYSNAIFKKQKSKHRIKLTFTNDQFSINEKITETILKNKTMPILEKKSFNDVIELLDKLYKLGEQRNNDEISTLDLFIQVKEMVSSNQQFPLIKRIPELELDISDIYIYLYLVWKTVTGNETSDIDWATTKVFDYPSEKVNYVQKLFANENSLVKQSLIEVIEADFFNDAEMKLSDKSIKMINELGLKLFTYKKKKENIIEPSKIQ